MGVGVRDAGALPPDRAFALARLRDVHGDRTALAALQALAVFERHPEGGAERLAGEVLDTSSSTGWWTS